MDGILSCAGGALFARGETAVSCRHMQSAIPSIKGKNRRKLIITSLTDVLRQQENLQSQIRTIALFFLAETTLAKGRECSNLICLRYKIKWNDAIRIAELQRDSISFSAFS